MFEFNKNSKQKQNFSLRYFLWYLKNLKLINN